MAQTTMTVDADANKCCDRLKHGREVTQFIIDLFKARIELENEYAIKLMKISQPEEASGKMFGIVGKKGATVTTGTLGASLQVFQQTTQQVAKIHHDMRAALIISLQALHEFAAQQERQRKPLADNTAKLAKMMQSNYSKMNDSRADRKSKEEKLIERKLDRDTVPKQKDYSKYEKAQKALEKAEKSLESAKLQQDTDETLFTDTRRQWEEHSANTYVRFKEMERERIVNLRCALWRFANIQSIAAVATDEQSAALRSSLRDCRSSIDIKEAIPVPDGPGVIERQSRSSPAAPRPQSEPETVHHRPPSMPKPPPSSKKPNYHPQPAQRSINQTFNNPPISNGGASGDHRANQSSQSPPHHPPQRSLLPQMSVEGPTAEPAQLVQQRRITDELKTRGNQSYPVQGQKGLRRMYPHEQMVNGDTEVSESDDFTNTKL